MSDTHALATVEKSVTTMHTADQYVVFTLDEQRFALDLHIVERTIHAVEVTPVPGAPEIVHGVINVQGRVIPIVNVRRRFQLPEREIDIGDQFLLARTARRAVGLVTDAVIGVVDCDGVVESGDVLPGQPYVGGIAKLDGDLILIHDLDRFLSLDEEELLDRALELPVTPAS